MPRVDQRDEPCRIDVGIDLGGGDVGMAEQSLQHAQIGPALEQVRGEGMAQDVRTDLARVEFRARARHLKFVTQPSADSHRLQIPVGSLAKHDDRRFDAARFVELASAVGVTKALVAKALKKLIGDGLVEKLSGRPARYVATGGSPYLILIETMVILIPCEL